MNLKKVKSSHIGSVTRIKKDLYILFHTTNEIYVFYGAKKHYKKMMRKNSKGKYFHKYIKDKYAYEIVGSIKEFEKKKVKGVTVVRMLKKMFKRR